MPRHPWKTEAEYNAHWTARVKARCVISESGCWVWQGGLSNNGYAQSAYRTRGCRVHRKMYEIANGVTLERWEYACHHCDIRNCVNPAHVWIGTPKDNQQDMSRKGRAGLQSSPTCKRGHLLSGDNVYRAPSTGRRGCKLCQRRRMRIAAGWPELLADTMDAVPNGYRPVNGKFRRRSKPTSRQSEMR